MDNKTTLTIDHGGIQKEITLIGTAHVSTNSVLEVKETIDEIEPDSICIELDQERYNSMINKDNYENTDIIDIIKQGKSSLFLVNLILSNYQKKIAAQSNIRSGEEMFQAINSAEEHNSELVLADRNIQTTFKRVWSSCSFWEKSKLITSIIFSIFSNEEMTEEELDQLKQKDMIQASIEQMGQSFPGIKHVLLDERNQYIAEKIKNAKGPKVVAVVGAAHVPGIVEELPEKHDIEELDVPGKKSNFGKYLGWGLLAVFALLIAFTFSLDVDAGIAGARNWLILVMVGAGIGAIIGGGNIPAIITAIVCAPLGAISPVLASGWFSGIADAYFRKPKVKDFESLGDDLSKISGFWKNKVTRVLLVIVFTNLGCAIGNVAGSVGIITTFLNTLLG